MSREERSGFKAQLDGDMSDLSKDKRRGEGTSSALTDQKLPKKSERKSESDIYEEEFEEIDEDLPENDDHLEIGN